MVEILDEKPSETACHKVERTPHVVTRMEKAIDSTPEGIHEGSKNAFKGVVVRPQAAFVVALGEVEKKTPQGTTCKTCERSWCIRHVPLVTSGNVSGSILICLGC